MSVGDHEADGAYRIVASRCSSYVNSFSSVSCGLTPSTSGLVGEGSLPFSVILVEVDRAADAGNA